MADIELVPGRFYSRWSEPNRYNTGARRVLRIADGKVDFVDFDSMHRKSIALKTFRKWACRELGPDEPVKVYAHVLNVRGQDVWHAYKYNFPMDYWYSLHHQEICCELFLDGSDDHLFDVRDLPFNYREGFEVEGLFSGLTGTRISPLEDCRRTRAAHLVAIGRALSDGYDILAGQRAANEQRAASEVERRQYDPADDLPF